jgi:hypothetical protein
MPMAVDDFFERLIAALERAEVAYMVTGSFASSTYGTPRATNDIDVVIAPDAAQLRELLLQFPNDRYYVAEEEAFEALESRSQFNIIDFASAWKADLIFRKDREFSRVEFSRRRLQSVAGTRVYLASAEDIVIAKLEWNKSGESERQIEDAAGIIRQQGIELDRAYVEQWVNALALAPQWRRALAKTE